MALRISSTRLLGRFCPLPFSLAPTRKHLLALRESCEIRWLSTQANVSHRRAPAVGPPPPIPREDLPRRQAPSAAEEPEEPVSQPPFAPASAPRKQQQQQPPQPPFDAAAWLRLGLSDVVVSALQQSHPQVSSPTAAQNKAIPVLMEAKPAILAAPPGTGKTLAYLLPILHGLDGHKVRLSRGHPRAVVLVPHGELGKQIYAVAEPLFSACGLKCAVVSGGSDDDQRRAALRGCVDLLIATPDALEDPKDSGAQRKRSEIGTRFIRHVVVEEPAFLFKMLPQSLTRIARYMQFVFVTAALPDTLKFKIEDMIKEVRTIHCPKLHFVNSGRLAVEFRNGSVHSKYHRLGDVIDTSEKTIVFCNTADTCVKVRKFLKNKGVPAVTCHGLLSSKARHANWRRFAEGDAPVLVGTRLAVAGLDTKMVSHVVLFDMPGSGHAYIDCVGRTARANSTGRVTAIVTNPELPMIDVIQDSVWSRKSLDFEKVKSAVDARHVDRWSKQLAELTGPPQYPTLLECLHPTKGIQAKRRLQKVLENQERRNPRRSRLAMRARAEAGLLETGESSGSATADWVEVKPGGEEADSMPRKSLYGRRYAERAQHRSER